MENTTTTTACAKCGGAMEEGFLADNNFSNVMVAAWIAGAPESSFWTGKSGVKLAGRTKRRVQTFRCTTCGSLESFATAEWPAA